MPKISTTYHDQVIDRDLIEATIQQSVDYALAPDSYTIILTLDDEIAIQAILGTLEK